ncbi:arylesterase [Hahella sp. CCB-MM4]|uniref:arylesterase n=1 Tax=Hahella sp. (strain CCB-MM4) TaxID=1926491 RepID=UPI000BD41E7B|nr:arylesterase [Hahella sp. CCB-MM4]OZG72206.1 arylesterase [Hahella sp. CCB-MM4]
MLIATTAFAEEAPTKVLIVGDSLSASYGIPTEQSWAVLLEQSYDSSPISTVSQPSDSSQSSGSPQSSTPSQPSKPNTVIINASISGETTGGARQRLPQLLKTHLPDITIIELGGNDGLRGFPLQVIKTNLENMISQVLEHNSKPVLIGMRIPPNYGPQYTEGFFGIFQELAEQYELPLIPFFLDGIALDSSLMQSDGIHPNATAQPLLLDKVRQVLDPVLAEVH